MRGVRPAVALCVWLGVALVGAASADTIQFQVEHQVYRVKGCVTFTDGEVLVPATACRDLLDGGLTWDGSVNTLIFHSAPVRLTFFAGKSRALVNGKEVQLTHRPELKRGKMYLPIGLLCLYTGAKMTRLAPDKIVIALNMFPKLTSPDQIKPLTIQVAGMPFKPEAYRCLPTFDQVRIWVSELADMLDGEVTWDRELRSAVLTVDGRRMVFFEDKDTAMLDGVPVKLSARPVLSKTKLLVPLDSTCEMLGRPLTQDSNEGPWQFLIGNPEG